MKLDMNLLRNAWSNLQKEAFVPGDPSGGGAPPPDPSMGGPPSGDPSMGGAPPMDPNAGGAPPPPAPTDPGVGGAPPSGDIAAQVAQGVQQAMSQSGLQGSGKPNQAKPDINTVATDIFQVKKMFLHFLRVQGIDLPDDILNGPNRSPDTGAPMASPTGGSDVPSGTQPSSAIKPISPMGGAFPSAPGGGGGGGMGKSSSDKLLKVGTEHSAPSLMSKVAAAAMVLRRRRELGEE